MAQGRRSPGLRGPGDRHPGPEARELDGGRAGGSGDSGDSGNGGVAGEGRDVESGMGICPVYI